MIPPSTIMYGSAWPTEGVSTFAQICSKGSPARLRKTTTQISPANMDSIKCSKYSIPKRDATSSANKLPPNGTPKKADNAPAMPYFQERQQNVRKSRQCV